MFSRIAPATPATPVAAACPCSSLTALKWSMSITATDRGARGGAALTAPGQLREDEAAVGEAGQRVREQHRLQPLGLHRRFLLKHLRTPGRVDAGDQLGVADRLDEEVLGPAAQRGDGRVEVGSGRSSSSTALR